LPQTRTFPFENLWSRHHLFLYLFISLSHKPRTSPRTVP
jgi:hypothetical protein